jgi:hypothetical protein
MAGRPVVVRDVDPPQPQMVRLHLTTRQVAELRRVATAAGINVSELLRRILCTILRYFKTSTQFSIIDHSTTDHSVKRKRPSEKMAVRT